MNAKKSQIVNSNLPSETYTSPSGSYLTVQAMPNDVGVAFEGVVLNRRDMAELIAALINLAITLPDDGMNA